MSKSLVEIRKAAGATALKRIKGIKGPLKSSVDEQRVIRTDPFGRRDVHVYRTHKPGIVPRVGRGAEEFSGSYKIPLNSGTRNPRAPGPGGPALGRPIGPRPPGPLGR